MFDGTIPVSHQAKIGIFFFGIIALLSLKNFFLKNEKTNDIILFLFFCVVLPFILVFVFSRMIKPIWITRAMMISLPSYYLLISIGSQQARSKFLSFGLMLVPIVWMGISAMFYIRGDHRMPYENIAGYLERETGKAVPILVENTYLMNPIFHYYKGDGFLYELEENNVSVIPADHKDNISHILSRKNSFEDRLVLVTYTSAEKKMKEEVESGYVFEKQNEFVGYGEEGQMRKVIVSFFKKKT
jgi:hypothetical protein